MERGEGRELLGREEEGGGIKKALAGLYRFNQIELNLARRRFPQQHLGILMCLQLLVLSLVSV